MENKHNHSEMVFYTVSILRKDATYWVVKHVKHVMYSNSNVIKLYLGEHGVDRKTILIPYNIIDHLEVTEEMSTGPKVYRGVGTDG